ncbi:MAG: flippase-like domain-containing protein [Gemmatimonadaceae bacterium]
MKRWTLTAISFAAIIAVSTYAVRTGAPHGIKLSIPPQAHLLALLAFAVEVVSRSLKLSWSANAVGTRLPFTTSFRTSLGGDFAASITPARVGAEPARFLILAQSGIPASEAMVILYLELFLEMISIAVVAVVIALAFETSSAASFAMIGVVGGYAAFVLGLGAVGVILARRSLGEEPPSWAHRIRLHGKRWEIVQRWIGRVRTTVDAFKDMSFGWAALALIAAIAHVSVRFTILPALIYSMTRQPVPLAPLIMWPLGIIYGAGVVPAPGGGGAVELAFRAALGKVIPRALFAPALVWWRFYTFYIYIAVGALVAGNTALRAVKEVEEAEEELERG